MNFSNELIDIVQFFSLDRKLNFFDWPTKTIHFFHFGDFVSFKKTAPGKKAMISTTRIRIDLNALRHNYREIKKIAPRSKALAVVKSDAYGHGLLRIAEALPHADGFALIQVDDLRQLREHGIQAPVLLMEGVFNTDELREVSLLSATVTICTAEQLEMVRRCRLSQPLDVWLKVNIGMNRFGFHPDDVEHVLALLAEVPGLRVRGLMTHFACADDLDSEIDSQWQTFHAVVMRTGLPYTAANSAATLRDARTHGAMVRTGSILYGDIPFARAPSIPFSFEPVMRLESRIIALSRLSAGAAFGYGASFTAPHDMLVGLVGCGYGDGYPYTAPTGTPVLVNGQRCHTLGKVAMNVLAVDLTHLPATQLGDTVTLWGEEGLLIGEVAQACGVSSVAMGCGLTKRLPVYVIGESVLEPDCA